jgi:hypothetical protein
MKTISLIMSILVVLFFAVSCGNDKSKEKSSDEIAENMVEKMIEKSTDGNVDVDIDQTGENAEMTIQGENGESVTVNVNSKEVPKNFPKDIYIVAGDIETSGTVKTGKGELITLIILPKGDVQKVGDDISKQMKAKGWTSTMNMNSEENNMYMFSKGDNTATINVTVDGGKTTVSYSVTVNIKE